jgi:hypothetical protein
MSDVKAAVVPLASRRMTHDLNRSSRIVSIALWIAAGLLLWPGLRVGPVFDDWFHSYDTHAAMSWLKRVFGLYEFFHADQVGMARDSGMLPWWSDDRLSISFFRPLSSLLLAIDHVWLDGGGLLSHVHSALWYGAVVVAAARVQRLLLGASEARWGNVLFALSSVHMVPLAFVASLHAHVTALFALLSFDCLIRAVLAGSETDARRLQWLSASSFVLALAAGESAVVLLPMALSYVWAERGLRRALALLAPHLVTIAVFLVAYFGLDMGTHHSGAYLQPGSAEFFRALVPRFLVLCAGLLAGFPPDLWMFGAQPVQMAVGIVALALGALALRAVIISAEPALDGAAARRLVALSAGALVSLLPVTSGVPGGRLVILPSVIASALFGMAGRRAVRGYRAGHPLRSLLLGAWVALFGIGLHPLFRVMVPLEFARIGKEIPAAARAVAQRCARQTALGIGVPEPNAAYLGALIRLMPAGERPDAFHLLSMAPGRHRIQQTAPDRYEVQIEGNFLSLPWARIYRDTPVAAPLTLNLHGVGVDLLDATADSMRLVLRVSPDSPTCWLTLDRGEFVPIDPTRPLDWTPTPTPRPQ